MYSGVTMKLRYLWPKGFQDRIISLSFDGRKRLSWLDWYFSHGKNARATCRHFGISPDTFYLWKNRFNPGSLITLEDNLASRRPKNVRHMTTPVWVQQKVYDIRLNDLEKSKYEIQAELKDQGILVGQTAIQKIINRHQELLNTGHTKRAKKRRQLKIARIKAAKELRDKGLGSLVQIDTKYFSILGARYYLFSAVDCKSRMGFVYPYTTISSASGKDFVKRVRDYFPFSIQAINTDNGSEYLLEFHKELEKSGITHFFSDPYCPKQNGRVERFHQTVEYEYLSYQDLYPSIELLRSHCVAFNDKYNNHRYHRAIGYKTPASFVLEYKQRQMYVI